MFTLLSDLDTSLRYSLFFLANIVLIVWTHYFVGRAKAGWHRFILAQPTFALCLMICFLFDFERPSDRVLMIHVVTNYLWLTPWKIFGFCLNRCQLTRAYESKSLGAFIVALLYNVNVAFETKPVDMEKKKDKPEDTSIHAFDDVMFVAIKLKGLALRQEVFFVAVRVNIKIVMTFISAYVLRQSPEGSFLKTFVCNWHCYFLLSGMQDIALLLSLLTLNLQLEDNFNKPWMSTSISEFWNARWNRVMGAQLREVCYNPMAEGRLIASRKYLENPKQPLNQRIWGMLLTFLASGLIHAIMLMHVIPNKTFPYRYIAFFVVSSTIVIMEKFLKHLLKGTGLYSMMTDKVPSILYMIYVHMTLQVLSYHLFWPDMLETGGVDKAADAVLSIINLNVFRLPRSEQVQSWISHETSGRPFGNRQDSISRNSALLEEISTPSLTKLEKTMDSIDKLRTFPEFSNWSQDQQLLKCCEASRSLSIAVLLSGGVDSSIALALLKAAGHQLTAFYLKIWFQEDFENFWDACPWQEDLQYAQEVCNQLGVPLKVVPLTAEYWERVAAHTIAEIKTGRTPNPDMLCNSRIKFGAFLEFLESTKLKFDRIASGHYAKLDRQEDASGNVCVELRLSKDRTKDQTYFLAQLNSQQLAKCIFPLGDLLKSEVRQLATIAGLPTMQRKDSQGICFLGKVKFNDFVERHLGKWPGLILEEGTKRRLGFHDGYWFHTIGQRTGLKLADGPWYVTQKDTLWNVVYVSRLNTTNVKNVNPTGQLDTFLCRAPNWLNAPPECSDLDCKVRHGAYLYQCRVLKRGPDGWLIQLNTKDQGLASGQFVVFYRNEICQGAGTIESSAVTQQR
eukprot:g1711.t1